MRLYDLRSGWEATALDFFFGYIIAQYGTAGLLGLEIDSFGFSWKFSHHFQKGGGLVPLAPCST